jgi:hypothetical protein
MRIKTYFENDSVYHRLHTYSKGSPYDSSGNHILYVKFRYMGEPAQLCLLDRNTESEQVIGESTFVDYHHGTSQYFCDSGRKIMYQKSRDTVAFYDIATQATTTVHIQGKLCNYSGYLDRHFIERDNENGDEFPVDKQSAMGLYLNLIDGKSRTLLADVETLLSHHPRGGDIRNSGILLRLGGDIRPDQKKVLLYLVGRNNTLVRDYFLCDFNGDNIEFLGRLGCHIMWCPDSRHIVSCVSPWSTDLGSLAGYDLDESKDLNGLLAIYDTVEKTHQILSDHPISGGSHQCPSPDGRRIAVDTCNKPEQSIYLFDMDTENMTEIHRFAKVPLRPDSHVPNSELRNHPHPAFSRDGSRVLINQCTDGVTRLCEIEL